MLGSTPWVLPAFLLLAAGMGTLVNWRRNRRSHDTTIAR